MIRTWSKKRGDRTAAAPLGALATETVYFTTVLMVGVFGLSLVLALQFAPSRVPAMPNMPGASGSPQLDTPVAAWIFGILFVAAIFVGGGRLMYRLIRQSASSEYRHVLVGRAGRLRAGAIDLISPGGEPSPAGSVDDSPAELPAVPRAGPQTDSPGERLRYRLPWSGPTSDVLGITALSLLFNAAWFVLAAIAVSGLIRGQVRPFLIVLLVPLAWIGVWLFRRMIGRVRASAGVGPTVVEISDHPLHPGETYDVFVAQWGRMTLRRLSVRLVCEEETFYRQGTDVRSERHEAMSIHLGASKNLQVDPHNAAEQQLQIRLPDDAMHSLAGRHNAIRWRIEVQGKLVRWPSFCRNFPVVIHPPPPPIRRSPR